MSVRVRVEPSGREFVAEERETLLEAALRAGLNLRYNCNSGTCGECRARLLAGRLRPLRSVDYAFGESEKGLGRFLLCSAAAAGERLVIEVPELRGAAEIPEQQLAARIARLECAGDYCILQLRTPRTHTLNFLAGQAAELEIAGTTRRLAIASCPCNGMVLQFHLRRDRRDPFASRLMAMPHGATVTVRGPYGGFLLDEAAAWPLVMVAEGTGFAPVKSLLEHAMALEWPPPIHLLWLAEPNGHYLEKYCRSLEDAFDDFHFLPFASGEEEALLAALAERSRGGDIYAAVTPPLAARLRNGVPAARLHFYDLPS